MDSFGMTHGNAKKGGADTISVAAFLSSINATLSSYTGRIEGEVTSIKKTYPTAIYFTIKDTAQDALLNCVIWRTNYNQNGVDLQEGDKIVVTGTPEIYAPRGTFSLKVFTIEYAGEGALKKAYEDLKQKLTHEGLLAVGRKRPLPQYPQKIGVITSRSGVVIQDFNSNLGRYGFLTTMVDSRMEGKDAIHEILAAIQTLAHQDIEVLVIMRGGGSWESLQAFNTESVVRALAEFPHPVITGIGHDVDVTLAELVADVGSSTPTAVAEKLNESWDTLTASLHAAQAQILGRYQQSLSHVSRSLESQTDTVTRRYYRTLTSVHRHLLRQASSVQVVFHMIENKIRSASSVFQSVVGILKTHIKAEQRRLVGILQILSQNMHSSLEKSRTDTDTAVHVLGAYHSTSIKGLRESISISEKRVHLSDPVHNLALGYSLSYVNGSLVRSVKNLKAGDVTTTRLVDGNITSIVKNIT